MNPHTNRDRGGYLRGIAEALRTLIAVTRAREADLRALRQVPHQLGSAKAEVLLDRDAELNSLSQTARAQFRNAVVGRSGHRDRTAVAARSQQIAADAIETYRRAARTPASWNREPRSRSRPDAPEDTEHATADADRATRDSDREGASDDGGSDDAATGTGDDPVPPWDQNAAAGAPDRVPPLANWPRWQDAQRVRDPDLVEFSAVVDEVVAEAQDSDEWGQWFDENDSLTMIVDDVLEDRRRDTEYRAAGDDLLDPDDRAESATDLDAGLPHEAPGVEPGVHDTAGKVVEDAPAGPAVVPDPLEQARQALDEIAADLAHGPRNGDPWAHDRGATTADRDVLDDQDDSHGRDPEDGPTDHYDDGRAEPW